MEWTETGNDQAEHFQTRTVCLSHLQMLLETQFLLSEVFHCLSHIQQLDVKVLARTKFSHSSIFKFVFGNS